jgi:predicted outer membrane repeat protein
MAIYWKRTIPFLVVLVLGLGLAAVVVKQTAAMSQVNLVGIGGAPCSYATIGEAIVAAADVDTIYVSAGTYNEVLGTVNKDLNFVAATADCTAANPDATAWEYVIDGGGANAPQGGMVKIASGSTVTFTRMTLQNASAVRGGIVYVASGATATFHTIRLREGSADDLGGIVYVAPDASLTVINTSFMEHGSAGNSGGGLYLEGEAVLFSGVKILACEAAEGGGVAMAGNGHLVLQLSQVGEGISPNSADVGGGVYMTGQSWLEMHQGSTIRWNSATSSNGGGIYATDNTTIDLYDTSRIYGNEAVQFGGGIYAEDGPTINLNDSSSIGDPYTTAGNQADYGGGIYADGATAIHIVDEATIMNNSAISAGGGIYLDHVTPLTMVGGAILNNQAGSWGGGIAVNNGQVSLDGTVVAENQAGERGGGISLENSSNNILSVTNSQILTNTASQDGGGVFSQLADVAFIDTDGSSRLAANQAGLNGGGLATSGSPEVTLYAILPGSQLRIEGNTAAGSGGGLYSHNQSNVYVAGNVWISGNLALGDGGGWYQQSGRMFALSLSQANGPRIAGNTTENGRGGGLYLAAVSSEGGDPASPLLNVTLAGNQADTQGGGLYVADGSLIYLVNALVHDNHAGVDGGGLYISAARVEIGQDHESCQNNVLPPNHYCSEFRNNSATGKGGAVGLVLAAEVSLEHTAVISNSAALGSGVMSASNGDRLEITNSLFTHNSGKTIYLAADAMLDLVHTTLTANEWAIDINDNGASPDLQNNIIWGNGYGVESEVLLIVGCSISQNGIGGVNSDPLFQTTGRGDYRLPSGSPAVDACPIGTDGDMDGVPRPQGAEFDAGAFEAGRAILLFPAEITVNEGDTGVNQAAFVISLSEASDEVVTVNVAAAGLEAVVGVDFQAINQTITFPPGVTSQNVPLAIIGDVIYEEEESFELQFSDANGAELLATTAVVVIADNETLPVLSVVGGSVMEGDSGTTPLNLVFSLSHPSVYTVTVIYYEGKGPNGEEEDFQDFGGILTFAPGQETAEITVSIYGDEIVEPNESFLVNMYNATGATIDPDGGQAWFTILNDDGGMSVYLPVIVNQ